MSEQGTSCEAGKVPSKRALKFTPAKEEDANLITSSVRKSKKGSRAPPSPHKSQALQHQLEAPSSGFADVPSPELKRRKVQVYSDSRERTSPSKQQNVCSETAASSDHFHGDHLEPRPLVQTQSEEDEGEPLTVAEQREEEDWHCDRPCASGGNSKDEAQTASPPRPPPELPPGIPAPPIPQGRVPMADRSKTPPGDKKPKGMLQTIFSPVFHIFQPGEGPTEGSEKGEQPSSTSGSQQGRRGSPQKPSAMKSRSRTPEQLPMADRLCVPPEAQQDRLRVQAEAEEGGRASEGASSTDGESETCLGNQRATMYPAREIVAEDSEGESDAGEEVYTVDTTNDMDEDSLEFDPYAFIKSLPPLEQCAPAWRRCLLPKQTRQCKRKTLVLDLDETLVHSTLDGNLSTGFRFEVFFNSRTHSVSVRQRPHLTPFLERCANMFEVVVFTASQKLYAEQLLNILDPQRKLIRHRIFRDDCLLVEGNYLKDLTVLGRDLANTIIVDNSPQAFGFQLENGVPIDSWYDDESDTELVRLLPFLESLVDVPDVRPLIVNAFKLQKLVDKAPHY